MATLREIITEACPILPENEVRKLETALHENKSELHPPQTVLEKANEIIHGERLRFYGHPNDNFRRIAMAWTQYASKILAPGRGFDPEDVCMMMALLKIMRMAEGYHSDSILDIAGYTALAAIVHGEDEL